MAEVENSTEQQLQQILSLSGGGQGGGGAGLGGLAGFLGGPGGFAAGESYFPDDMGDREYYQPVAAGLEIQIGEKLAVLRKANRQARKELPGNATGNATGKK